MPTSKDLSDLDSQLKKTVISAEGFKRGSSLDFSKSLMNIHKTLGTLASHTRKLVIRVGDLEKTVDNNSRKITSLKNISKTQSERISGTNLGAKLPGSSTSNVEDNITAISKSVSSIAEILSGRKKLLSDTAAYEKRKEEQDKRALAESKLEKRFEGLKRTAEKIIAPVKSLLDKIIDFFVTIFLGRIVYKLLEWFGNKENANKVRSVIRFLGDHWPKLLALYLTFGTSLGKFSRGLIKVVARGAFLLAGAIARLIGARKAARFLGGRGGRLASAAIGTAVTLGGTYAATQALKGSGEEPKAQGLAGGGYVKPRIPTFSGGGFNFKGMLGGAGLGSMFGPLGMLVGGALGSGKPQEMVSGFVSGEKGVDKVPAMLSDGEFVMSRGAVQKYGVDTLEAMNAAGGGTNKPKIMSGTTYAKTGGLMGNDPNEGRNVPFMQDPFGAVNRFLKYKFGADLDNKSTWGPPSTIQKPSSLKSISSGSLLTDPVGAVARIANNMGIKTPDVSSGGPKMPSLPGGFKLPSLPSGGRGKPGQKNMFQEISEKLQGPGAATYRDAGSIYAKQMLGGFGGPISERDLGKESQQELQKAIQRAKKRTGSEISKAEAKIKELRAQGAKDGNPALETQKSFLKKLKAGGIRVQYADYADEKGKMSESAKNAKNILGQFWANERSKKEGGGYRIEDKYDFDKMKDPMGVLFGKGKTTQQRLQALHQMNPLKGGGDVDMVLGGKRTAAESWGLSGSKTLLGGMLGASGKPKDKNTQALEAKRPWWDKAGWFGGGSRIAQEQVKKAQLAKRKPKANPVKPPAKPKPKVTVVAGGGQGGRRGGRKPSKPKVPQFSATTKGSNAKASVLGVHR